MTKRWGKDQRVSEDKHKHCSNVFLLLCNINICDIASTMLSFRPPLFRQNNALFLLLFNCNLQCDNKNLLKGHLLPGIRGRRRTTLVLYPQLYTCFFVFLYKCTVVYPLFRKALLGLPACLSVVRLTSLFMWSDERRHTIAIHCCHNSRPLCDTNHTPPLDFASQLNINVVYIFLQRGESSTGKSGRMSTPFFTCCFLNQLRK